MKLSNTQLKYEPNNNTLFPLANRHTPYLAQYATTSCAAFEQKFKRPYLTELGFREALEMMKID